MVIGGILLLSIISLTGCGARSDQSDSTPPETSTTTQGSATSNTDPRRGWVEVFVSAGNQREDRPQTIYKRCDGKALIYIHDSWYTDIADGITAIPDSPECIG